MVEGHATFGNVLSEVDFINYKNIWRHQKNSIAYSLYGTIDLWNSDSHVGFSLAS